MVGDITYIETWECQVFLATVIDCAIRKITGWAMDDNYKTPLISRAIEMAATNVALPEDAIFHSGRGGNYTSGRVRVETGRTRYLAIGRPDRNLL
jgi:transposase InsO family protein